MQFVRPEIMEALPSPPQSINSPASSSGAACPQPLVQRPKPAAPSARPSRRRGQYDPQVWEANKDRIRNLYLVQGQTLREVIDTMAKTYNFHATEKMFKIRIKQWGFSKNNTRKEVAQMLKARFVREAMGKRSEFTRNGRTVDIDDYLRRKGLTEYDVVDLESPVQEALRIVRCRTPPEPENLGLPERLKHQEGYVLAIRRALLFWASDPMEQDRNHWVTHDYSYIKDLRDALGLAERGDTGRAIETLQTVLQTKLRDVDMVDAVGGVWLMLVPVTWSHVPIIATTLFKYLVASGIIKSQKGHPVSSALKYVYDTMREGGLSELKFIVEHSLSTVFGEIERAMGSDYGIITRMWPWYVAERGPTTMWMMRGQILRRQQEYEAQFGIYSRESLWERLSYAVSFTPGSKEHLAHLQNLFEIGRLTNDIECLCIARGGAYFAYSYHWSVCKKEPAEYNMRLSLARYWFAEAYELERRMRALKPLYGTQPTNTPAQSYSSRCLNRREGSRFDYSDGMLSNECFSEEHNAAIRPGRLE
ncbi:hypothetical protein VM1G_06452 [Cytospora mali]|uniref:Clr5 domain-containing protein n=1 Tax=Cytospora mali TaxID=578113 RepID=A0A194W450_CYTMA|nr:hypothetical protein VM1G_06452 [Valsa mali]